MLYILYVLPSDDGTWNGSIRVCKPFSSTNRSTTWSGCRLQDQVIMEEEQKKQEGSDRDELRQPQQPPYISQMEPVTHEAYGGGLYGRDDEDEKEAKKKEKEPPQHKPPASETQSADGPDESKTTKLKHKQPPSSGDIDIDITGQSYIQ